MSPDERLSEHAAFYVKAMISIRNIARLELGFDLDKPIGHTFYIVDGDTDILCSYAALSVQNRRAFPGFPCDSTENVAMRKCLMQTSAMSHMGGYPGNVIPSVDYLI